MKKIFWAAAAIVFVFAAYRAVEMRHTAPPQDVKKSAIGGEKKEKTPIVAPPLKIKTIKRELTLTLTGKVRADAEVNVRPKTAGRVEEIYVREGDFVKAGDALLSYISGIDPGDEIYDDMVVRSPISGIIGAQMINEGEQVTNSVGVINHVFIIYSVDNVKIYAQIPEKYVPSVSKGIPAEISIVAFPKEVLRGYINNISPVINPISRTTQVEIRFPNKDYKIKPGMSAKAEIMLQ